MSTKAVERRWLATPIPLPDGSVAWLGCHWPMSEEDLILLRAGIELNLALASYVAGRQEEQARAA